MSTTNFHSDDLTHRNTGHCHKCRLIMNKYPGLHPLLESWFDALQEKYPEAHVSCAGRNERDQELAFHYKQSKARWKQSAHNYNLALDIFRLDPETGDPDWSREWYYNVLKTEVSKEPLLEWAGNWNHFRELVHVQLREWHMMILDDSAFPLVQKPTVNVSSD